MPSLESNYSFWRPAGPSAPGAAATTSKVEFSLEALLRLFLGPVSRAQLSPWRLWHHLCCSREYKQATGEKRSCLICCESSLHYGSLWREAQSWGQQLLFAAYRGESKGEGEGGWAELCLCVCLHGLALSCSISQAMQRRGHICWARTGHLSTVLGAGGRVWRPAVTVKALQSSPAASQASSREFGHFSFSTGGHCLAYINILYFPAVILGGRWEDTMKLLGQSFSLNAPSSFHSSVFYLGYEYLSSQSFWLWWTSYTCILLVWCKFFAHAWFGGRALAVS